MEHNAPWGIKTMAEELNQEETLNENNDSLNVEEEVETEEVETDNSPTLEDYEALKQKNKELYERAKKAETLAKAKKEALSNKPNETQSGLTKDEVILYAKGHTEDEVELAKKLASLSGISPLKATEDEIFKSKVNSRIKKEIVDKLLKIKWWELPDNEIQRLIPYLCNSNTECIYI
jgi:hypothetical protein